MGRPRAFFDGGQKVLGHDVLVVVIHFLLGFLFALAFILFIIYNRQRLHTIIVSKKGGWKRWLSLRCGASTELPGVDKSNLSEGSDSEDNQDDSQLLGADEDDEDDDELLSEYDIVSSDAISRRSSDCSVGESAPDFNPDRPSKVTASSGRKCPKNDKSSDKKVENGLSGDSVYSAGRSRLLNKIHVNINVEDATKLIVVRLFKSQRKCGRYRVNPVKFWYAKVTLNNLKLKSNDRKHENDNLIRLDAASGDESSADNCAVFRTKHYQDGRDILMEEEFKFSVDSIDLKSLLSFDLSCTVLEYDEKCKNDNILLGSGILPVEVSKYASPIEDVICTYAHSEVSESSVLVSLNYLPLAERLSIIVMKAKDLKLPDPDITPKSVYVKVEMFKREKRLKKKKTSTKFNTVNPVFNDMLGFDLARSDLKNCRLKVSVVQRVKPDLPNGTDPENQGDPEKNSPANMNYYVFGVIHLGARGCSKSESDHFQQMLKSPRVPIAKWHLLRSTTF